MENEIIIPAIVKVTGNTAKFESNKDITGVTVNYNEETNQVVLTIPVPKQVDRSPNPSIFVGKHTPLSIKIHKDGRFGTSGIFSRQKVLDKGKEFVYSDFMSAAEALWEHCNC